MKLNVKKALNKKTISLLGGAAAGFYGGVKLTESGVLDQVTSFAGAEAQPYVNGGLKVVAGAIIYSQAKGEMIKGAGLGLGVNGGVDIISTATLNGIPGLNSFTAKKWSNTVNGNDPSLNGNDPSLQGYDNDGFKAD